jgi:hypothetical protein
MPYLLEFLKYPCRAPIDILSDPFSQTEIDNAVKLLTSLGYTYVRCHGEKTLLFKKDGSRPNKAKLCDRLKPEGLLLVGIMKI